MKVKLIKPFKVGNREKPKDRILDVTAKYGNELIEQKVAEEYIEKPVRVKRPKKEIINKPKID